MKKIGSVMLMLGLVCFLGGIVGCPATPVKKSETKTTTTEEKKVNDKGVEEKKTTEEKKTVEKGK